MTSRIGLIASLGAAFLLCGVLPATAQVQLEFKQGRVNLSTQNATARTILAEWARLGGTRILNGERVAGPPLTLELMGVSERQALDVILRGVSGYMIASREVAGSGASAFDRIMILPTSTAPRVGSAPTPTAPPATFSLQQPGVDSGGVFDNPGSDDDALDVPQAERPFPVNTRTRIARPVPPPNGGNGGPIINGGPVQNGVVVEDQDTDDPANAPVPAPGNPFGVVPGSARPGFVPQPPPQQGNRRPDVEN